MFFTPRFVRGWAHRLNYLETARVFGEIAGREI